MKRTIWHLLAGLTVIGLSCVESRPPARSVADGPIAPTPPATYTWAAPIEKPGLRNFHRVTKDLYRGGQPSGEGMRQLAIMGIKTVVNLRTLHTDRDEIGDLPLRYEQIHINAWHPEDEDVIHFLKIVADKNSPPVFVHCHYGSDRTGTMCAIYRIVIDGWPKEEALREMTEGGFGYHSVWKELLKYIQALDVDHMKKEAGL